MNDFLILCDTRQKYDSYITSYFDNKKIPWVRDKLPSADYMALRWDNGFIKDYSVLIDTKKDVEEIAGNLCKTSEHERIKAEIERAKELGCREFVFLICDAKIKTLDDLKNWRSNKTKVKGEVLLKVMCTMAKKYNIKFLFTTKHHAGVKIVELLQK